MNYSRTYLAKSTSPYVSVPSAIWVVWQSSDEPHLPVAEYGVIYGNSPIKFDSVGARQLNAPISVVLRPIDGDEFLASFEEAGIEMTGSSATDALHSLKSAIVELYDLLRAEVRLGPGPQQELAILERYLGEQGRQQARAAPGRANC